MYPSRRLDAIGRGLKTLKSNYVKVALVGSGGAGKTTLSARLVTGQFVETMMTVGLNVETWSIENESADGNIKAALFDLGGQKQFRFFQASFLEGTHAVLILIDLTRFGSLLEVDDWVPMIQHIPRDRWLLVANKSDEEYEISAEDIKEKAEELGIPHIFVSAKTGENFEQLVRMTMSLITDPTSQ